MTLAVLALYAAVLVAIGVASARSGRASAEDYFLAGRSFGTLVLFMALLGTNVTAFAMIGLPGLAYHEGVGIFGFFGAMAAFATPLTFILLGYPIWKTGRALGAITPSQLFEARWRSPAVGHLVFASLAFYTLPYMIVGLIGGGIALTELSGDAISYAAGAGAIALVVVLYTSVGGMRGTAWTNVFQAGVFLVFIVVAAFGIAEKLGGASALHARIAAEAPHLLGKSGPRLAPAAWATGILVGPVSVIAFPHMFLRLMAAKDAGALRRSVHLYPWALALLFVPVTLIGVWGAVDVPDLVGRESDRILPLLVERHLPAWLGAVGLAAILAAVMSSLDAQLLTLSTMLTIDLFGRFRKKIRLDLLGRGTIVAVAGLAYLVALRPPESIFGIAAYAFSGYTLLVPVMVAAFYWRRSTAAGIVAGSLAGHGTLALYYAKLLGPEWTLPLPDFGLFPVAICLAIETAVIVAVSLATRPPSRGATAPFDDPLGPASVLEANAPQ